MIARALLDVEAFNAKFPPRPAVAVEYARRRMIAEEAEELAAEVGGDRVKVAHEAIDLIYVALGALVEAGISPEEAAAAWAEVHRANMAKVVEPGQWKARKPEGWRPPDVRDAMARIATPCTEWQASWCPRCGTCKGCDLEAREAGVSRWRAPTCPLHGEDTDHGDLP